MKFRRMLAVLLAAVMVLSTAPMSRANGTYFIDPSAVPNACSHPNMNSRTSQEATCTQPGVKVQYCPDCQFVVQVTIPALGHNWVVGYKPEATCTTGGFTQYVCSRCGAFNTIEHTDPLGHDMGEWYAVSPGKEQRDCIRGDYSEYRDVENPIDETVDLTVTPEVTDGPTATLTLILNNSPASGPYFTNGDRTAYFTTLFTNTGTETIRNVTITYPGSGSKLKDVAIVHEVGPGETVTLYSTHTICPGTEVFTKLETELQNAEACFDAPEGIRYVYSNDIVMMANGAEEEENPHLSIVLSMPELPERGYFIPGETVDVPATLSVNMDFTGLSCAERTGRTMHYPPDLKGGETYAMTFPIQISEKNGIDGSCGVRALARGRSRTGITCISSDVLYLPCGIEKPDDRKEELSFALTALPADNGSHYVLNEVVTYYYYVMDSGADPFAGEFEVTEVSPKSESLGEHAVISRTHTVTPADVEAGTIQITGNLVYTTSYLDTQSLTRSLTLTCGPDLTENASVIKTVTSTPDNGGYYVVGEWVSYTITVTNTGSLPITDGRLEDSMLGLYMGSIALEPGESFTTAAAYQVTAADAEAGTLSNVAWFITNRREYPSNEVVVKTGGGRAPQSLSIFKMLDPACKPAHGPRFSENETLSYIIVVTNPTEDFTFFDVTVTDDRDSSFSEEIGDMLPGATVYIPFTSTVTKGDCDSGWALNTAYVTGRNDLRITIRRTSNTVAVPAGNYRSVLTGDDCCRRTPLATGEGVWQYDQHYCGVHAAVREQVKDLDYVSAYRLWQGALDELYSQWFGCVIGEQLVAAQEDQMTFGIMVEYLEAAHGSQEMILSLLEYKCAELCFELHTVFGEVTSDPKPLTASRSAACTEHVDSDELSRTVATVTLCQPHSDRLNRGLNDAMGSRSLSDVASATYARMNAKATLKAVYGQLCAGKSDEQGEMLMTACTAWLAYLEQHENTLSTFRTDDFTALTEIYLQGIQDQIVRVCGGK